MKQEIKKCFPKSVLRFARMHPLSGKKTNLANDGSYVSILIRLIHSKSDISNESKVDAVKMVN